MNTTQHKLQTVNLSAYYGDKKILNNINVSIEEKSVTALIGPSGCGKSTFLRMFNRMNDYIENFRKEGDVLVDGVDIYDRNKQLERLRHEIGMVFQKPNPFPKSIYENVAYGLRVQGIKNKQELNETVEKSLIQAALFDEVKDDLKKNALRLSGGQQQRLCIARTLAVSPSVILMDEPAASLDPIATSKIEHLIGELKKEYTILIVTHNLQQAERISDYTGYLYFGEMMEFGTTHQVFTNPNNQHTSNYISGHFG